MDSEMRSRFLVDQEAFAAVLKAALKVAGKEDYAAVRLRAGDEGKTLWVSAVNPKATFVASLRVDVLEWLVERDDVVELSVHAAKSIAGYKVQVPKDAEVQQLVSVTIGDERVRVQDETGLWSTPGGRDEHRLSQAILGGDHNLSVARAEDMKQAVLWCGPEQIKLVSDVVSQLRRPLTMIKRAEPTSTVSRWIFGGPQWALTMTSQEEKTDEDDTAPTTVKVTARPLEGFA